MKQFLLFAILILFAGICTIIFPPVLTARPNFLFLLIVFFSFKGTDEKFLLFAFSSGLLLDVFSGSMFGSFCISALVVAIVLNYTTRTFFKSEPSVIVVSVIIPFLYLLFVGIAYILNSAAFHIGLTSYPISNIYLLRKVWIDIGLNLIFALPVYAVAEYAETLTRTFKQQRIL